MHKNLFLLEPERTNSLLKWWSLPEATTLVESIEKWRQVALLEAIDLQEKSMSERGNLQFAQSASEKLAEAADMETCLRVLSRMNSEQQFISKIEL